MKRIPFLNSLEQIFGSKFSKNFTTLSQHGSVETYHHGVNPLAVVYPTTVKEVEDTCKLCSKENIPIVGFGAGTSLEGQLVYYQDSGICMNFSKMNKIFEINPENMDCLVEPGVTRENLNYELRHTGLFFPIDPGADSSIGGMVATNASGTTTLRYGSMKQNVMGLEFVTIEGKRIKSGSRARKTSAGYDLRGLMIGSEGTLGLLTKIRLKLHPIAENISVAVCSFDSLKDAIDLVTSISLCGIQLARMELIDILSIKCINKFINLNMHVKDTVFLEFHGSETVINEQMKIVSNLVEDYNGLKFETAIDKEDRNRLWKARHNTFWSQKAAMPGKDVLVTDVAVPVDQLSNIIITTQEELENKKLFAPCVGHVGDGNFHFSIFHDLKNEKEKKKIEDFSDFLVEKALEFEGTCTGEHGIGLGKMKYLIKEFGEDTIEVMLSLKRAFDPHNLLNPGKIVNSSYI